MRKLIILLTVLSVMMSCDLFAPDDGGGSGGTLSLAEKVEAALYEVPESLRGGSDSLSGTAASRALDGDISVSSDLTDIYGLLSEYLGYADDARSLVESFVVTIITQENLGDLVSDTVYLIDDAGDLTGLALITNPDYTYDIQLYTDTIETLDGEVTDPTVLLADCVTEPALKIRFNEADGGVEGEAWFVFTDESETETEITLYVAFDSDGSDGTLILRFYVDTDGAVSAGYTGTDLEEYNYRPDRIFMNLSKTGNIVKIEGTSYHPRVQENADWVFSGVPARTMYSFTAVAQTDTGAVVNLALPLDTAGNNNDLWTTYNLGTLWKEVVKNELNAVLAELGDDDDTTLPDGFTGNHYIQQFLAAYLMDLIVDLGLDTFDDYRTGGSDFTQTQFDNAYTFWTNTGLTEITTGMDSITSGAGAGSEATWVNSFFNTAEPTEEQLEDMENFYIILTAPELIDAAADESYTISGADLIVTYALNGDPYDEWAGDLFPFVAPCLYMINPAFFSESDGLLGTLNEGNDTFYGIAGMTGLPAEYDTLVALLSDLDALEPFIPAEVAASTIPTVGVDPGI